MTVLPGENVHTDNIVVILDASGSMGEEFSSDPTKTRMNAAKEALQTVLTTILDGTNIGLLVFSGSNVKNHWVYPLGPKDNEALIKAINFPLPGGTTPLGTYLKIGANRLLEQREKQYNYGSYRLLVVTDGAASDPDKVRLYTPEIMHKQIRIDVIGVDMEQDHMLATVVDSYRRAGNPEQLIKAVSEVLAEVAGTGIDSGGEVYSLISPLTEELASSLIDVMTKVPGNQPIGKQLVTPEQATKVDTANQIVNANTNQPSNQDSEMGFHIWFIIIIISFSVIMWVVFKNRNKSSQQ